MSLACCGHAAEEISAANDDGDLHAERVDVRQFGGNLVNARRIDAKALVRRQGLAGELEQNAFEDRSRGRHGDLVAPVCSSASALAAEACRRYGRLARAETAKPKERPEGRPEITRLSALSAW